MSLGPVTKDEQIKMSSFDRARHEIKKVTEEYFKKPLYYLLYGMLGMTIVGLFFGLSFPWQYYSILIILTGIETYSFYQTKEK